MYVYVRIYVCTHDQVIDIPARQLPVKEFLVQQHLEGLLACLYELGQYRNPLCCAPLCFAALADHSSTEYDVCQMQERVLESLKQEWELVLCMESDAQSAPLLRKLCPHTLWQSYREQMVVLEAEGWTRSKRFLEMCLAYAPPITSSANIEDSFASIQDAVNRSGKSDLGSLANIQAVHLRGCVQKMTGLPHQGRSVALNAADFEGPEIRGLRAKLFQPTSFSGSFSIDNINILRMGIYT